MNSECPVNLMPHQVEHTQRIWNLLIKDKVLSYIDTSKVGLGKTHVALAIAWHLQKLHGLRIMIVAPSVQSLENHDGWLNWAKKYDIEISIATTYSQLRSQNSQWVKHIGDKNYVASEDFIRLTRSGLFLIFDEFHKTTRKSKSHWTASALVRACKQNRDRCRIGLLSFTPGDKPDHCPQILRMAGIITQKDMFHHIPFTSNYEWRDLGLGELGTVCMKINPAAIDDVENQMHHLSASKSGRIAKNLMCQYINPINTFAMPKPESRCEKFNAFLDCDPESLEMLEDGIRMLTNSVRWNGRDVGDRREWNLGGVTLALKAIENAKLKMMISYVQRESKKNPRKKFILMIGARNIEHQKMCQEFLVRTDAISDKTLLTLDSLRKENENWKKLPKEIYNIILENINERVEATIMNGKTPPEERVEIIKKFQEDNNSCWCLLMTPGVGSEAISLQPKHPNRPHDLLIVPDHFFTRIVQGVGRVDRVGMRSDSKVLIVYAKQATLETSILNCMMRKTRVAKDLLAKNQKEEFPGEFPFFIENKKEEDRELEERLNVLRNNFIQANEQ